MTFVRTLKRIRLDKTNYHKRAAVIIGRHSFVAVRVSDQNVAAQMIVATPKGDLVIASAHSHELAKYGWKGSANNLPACYLTGLILGKKVLEKGTHKAVLYIGKEHFTTRVAACAKGIVDAGVDMPLSEESVPSEERMTGKHIADYASSLKSDEQQYNSRFSTLLKNGLKPEDYPAHFEEVRSKISGKPLEAKAPKEKKEKEEKKETAKKEAKPSKEKSSKKETKETKANKKSKEGKKKK